MTAASPNKKKPARAGTRVRTDVSRDDVERHREVAIAVAREAARSKCTDVTILEVAGLSPVCDHIVIASGTSSRQMKSVADDLADVAKAMSMSAWRRAIDTGGSWIVVDLVHVVVHLFEPGQREYYDIEGLWRDGAVIPWAESPSAKGRAAS
ncbi:MAG: ribosome silencing factor [Planctomycetota bacterium]|nr:ribosome silencing factor [Planctomycetota bacterium]MDA1105169.1 ribosome silencing factor [Planctomycetota bacterium]